MYITLAEEQQAAGWHWLSHWPVCSKSGVVGFIVNASQWGCSQWHKHWAE